MQNKKMDVEKARLAAELAQERIDEMAKTSEYHVDETLKKAGSVGVHATKSARAPRAASAKGK